MSRNLTNVCTFAAACQSIQSAAEKKEKASCLHILNSIYGDLIVAEATYHGNLSVNSTAKHHSFVKYIVLQALSNKR